MNPAVIILAGGLATRLRPITEKIPKSLVEINGKPFLHFQLLLLKKYGFKKIVLSVGYLGEQIETIFKDGSEYGLSIKYSYDGDKLLGTGGAIKKALPLLTEDFIVLYGDSYLKYDYAKIVNFYQQYLQAADALMTVFKNEGLYDSSNIVFDGEKILVYDKKIKSDQMQYIDWGLGIINKRAFQNFNENVFDLAEVYKQVLDNKRLLGYEVDTRFYEIGSLTGLDEAKTILEL